MTAPVLTEEQARKLGDKLIDTSGNIYRVAEMMFPGFKLTDADFELVEKVGELFKCEECNLWQDGSMKSVIYVNRCVDCDD